VSYILARRLSTLTLIYDSSVTSNESDDEGTPPPVTTRTTRKPGRAVALRNKATEVVPAAAAPPAEPTYSALPPSPVRSIHPPSPVRSVHPPSPVRSVLPPSPVRSIFNEVREAIEEPEVVVERIKTSELLRDSQVYLDNLRAVRLTRARRDPDS